MTTLSQQLPFETLSLLSEEPLRSKILEFWSDDSLTSDHFYRTGYETILYNQDLAFAMETVITSVMQWEKELLIVGESNECNQFKAVAKHHSIHGHTLCDNNITGPRMDTILKFFPEISHVLIHANSSQWIQTPNFKEVVQTAVNTGRDVIVTSNTQLYKLTDWFKNTVSFIVGRVDPTDKKSFIVARRNKLVQTEGNARSSRHDLYGHWQWSMRNRTPIIEPM